MKLSFDPESNVYQDHPGDDVVIIETASIDDMPHSVFLFLEQIDHHLYDHSSFHRNSPHLIQAGPSNSPASHARFRHHPSLQAVIFQEYAPEMSHKQYTLGYSGRPGGPDFYVNMRDNSALHGPGGQHHPYADISRDADPCFAKVIRGFEAIERVHRAAVMDSATNDAMVHPIVIDSIKVLPHDYRPPPSPSRIDSTSKEEENNEEEEQRRPKNHYLLEEYVEDIL
jgi:cyclophilin family peptidyl-prolyl cis-trans isomerase